jgi:hypothetical protein
VQRTLGGPVLHRAQVDHQVVVEGFGDRGDDSAVFVHVTVEAGADELFGRLRK